MDLVQDAYVHYMAARERSGQFLVHAGGSKGGNMDGIHVVAGIHVFTQQGYSLSHSYAQLFVNPCVAII